MRLREKRRPCQMTAIEILRHLEQTVGYTSWGGTILFWARRHLETSADGPSIRYGQPGSVDAWLKTLEFWDGKEAK